MRKFPYDQIQGLRRRKDKIDSGDGRIWMETVRGERFSDLRVEQAVGVGAEVLVTACPYCITHFEDSRLTLEDSESLVVKDITEIIRETI